MTDLFDAMNNDGKDAILYEYFLKNSWKIPSLRKLLILLWGINQKGTIIDRVPFLDIFFRIEKNWKK